MPMIQDTVRPGDVISSELLNRIIALLNEHEVKIAGGTSGGGGQLITGFSPASQQNVNRNLTVFGNFDFPLGPNALSIDGLPINSIDFLPGSNHTQLIFRIPATIAVPANGTRQVLVRIVNTKGTDQRPYTLLPEVAGPPDPTISSVRDSATSSTTLRSGMEAQIVGRNFASTLSQNTVELVLNPGPSQTAFPLTVKSSSTVVPAPGDSTLRVDMPTLTDAHGVAIGDSAPATLTVTVTGANSPAIRGISIDRIA